MNIQKVLLGSLAAVIIYNLLFFQVGLGMGTGLFFLLIHSYLFFTRNKHASIVPALVSSIVSVIFAFLLGFRANGEVQFINLIVALVTTSIAVYFYRIDWKDRLGINRLLITPFLVAGSSIVAAFKLLFPSQEEKTRSNFPFSSILRGLVITVPIFFILLVLLVNADPVFKSLSEKILSQSLERIILSGFLFGLLVSTGLSMYEKAKERVQKEVGYGKPYELGILGGTIAVLFGAFIMVQFQYLFSQVGERELGELGIKSLTYSEYVRKGFFELLVASTIAGGVITYLLHYIHRLSSYSKTILQLLTGLLTLETGMLLYSAFMRVSLYADGHGLTRARIWGFLFLLWLFGMLVILLVRTVRELSSEKTAYAILGITIAVLLGMNIVNIDNVIATKYPPTVNNELDYSYISMLSADAYPEWDDIVKDVEKKVVSLESKTEVTPDDQRIMHLTEMTLVNLEGDIASLLRKYGTEDEYFQSIQSPRH